MMALEGQQLLEEAAERTGVTIRIFGEQAPALRTPPGVVLPAVPPLAEDTHSAREALRADISKQREEYRQATEPIMHPGESTYDSETGTVAIGECLDGTVERHRLHDPSTGMVDSTIIFGDSGTGRSHLLSLLIVEAKMTGVFLPVAADVAAKGEVRVWCETYKVALFVEGVDKSVKLLEDLCQEISRRTTEENYSGPSRETPAILLGIDDADLLLRNERGVSLIERILTDGGTVGIGVVLVLGDITEFEYNPKLIRNLLVHTNGTIACTDRGISVLVYLNAKYVRARSRTWTNVNTPFFVVHQDKGGTVLGVAAASLDNRVGETSAKIWATKNLQEFGLILIEDWQQVDEEAKSWWNIDINFTYWFLRRHEDVWLLVMAETNAPKLAGPELIEWAEAQIEARFEVELREWQIGPGTGAADSAVFYIDTGGEIVRKDRSELIKRTIADLY